MADEIQEVKVEEKKVDATPTQTQPAPSPTHSPKKILKKIHDVREDVRKKVPIFQEFKDFLEEYKVLGLAVAVIMGLGLNALVKSLVDNIIMPIITPFIPGGAWATSVLKIGPIALGWGPFVSALIYFLILSWTVFLIVRYMFGKKKVSEIK